MRVMVGYTEFECVVAMLHVNVTIKFVPYNDSESHGTFEHARFCFSVESLQQRGVGTSTNGSGAFGASLNMLTDSYAR
jgi:iron complex outermembrane receptor protein